MSDKIEGTVGNESDTTALGKDIDQEVNKGNIVYVYPEGQKSRPRGSRRTSTSMAATVEEKIRDKLNEHDVKLAKLEIADATTKENMTDYVRELRQDIVEIKAELRPLRGLGILAQPQQTSADKEAADRSKEQAAVVVRLLTIIAVSFVGVVILILFIFVWSTLRGA